MKEIKIFIGSSVDKKEFEIEREKLGSFINGLNRKYVKQGIFIDLYDCETVSNKMRAEGSQKQHDDYIEKEADATFFMFFKKAGEFTLHELQVAHDALVRESHPDVFIYFKVVGDDIEQTEEIKKAVDVIANTYGHYFSKFADVDTIKLGMLQYLMEKLNDGSSITINEGRIYLNNVEVDGISIDNIFAYQNNGEYKRLQNEIEALNESINDSIESKQFDNIEALTIDKEEKEKLLATLEKDILNMLIQMQKELKKSNANSLRMRAYQLLEMGKIKEAQKLLPIEILKLKSNNLLMKKEIEAPENEELVADAEARIEALKLDVSNEDRFKLIEETYESVLENAFLCFDDIFVYNYCSFLGEQNRSKKAIVIGTRLEGLYLLHSDRFKESDLADLYNNILGPRYSEQNEMNKAEEYLLKAIEIREALASENPERFNPYLAMSYNNAGILYNNQGQVKKAEEYYLKALEIIEALASENPERFDPYLACIYNNAGNFYEDQGQVKKAEEYYLKAIEIRETLASENPERFNPDLAWSYNNAGVFYNNQGQVKKAEECHLKAIEIREMLAAENPERFNPDLANSYNNAGAFYKDQGQVKKAEEYVLKAIRICEALVAENPERVNHCLATCYNNVGIFYTNQGQAKKAEEYYLKAIEIREVLAAENPERYNHDLAESYNNAGIFYKNQGQVNIAEEYYLKAIEIWETLAAENPERFYYDLATSYNNVGIYYNNQGQVKKAEEYCLKAIEIREALAAENPERYNPNLAASYYIYAVFSKNNSYFDKALELAKTRPEHPHCRQIIKKLGK